MTVPYKNLGWLLLSLLIATPVAAHTKEVSGDVGDLLHIEPQDNPVAQGKVTKINNS